MESLPKPPQSLLSRFRGAVLGAAIGDALAFPNQHYSRTFLGSFVEPLSGYFATPPTGLHPRGQYGAATQVMLAVLSSIVESRQVNRDSIVSHMIPLWRDNLLVEREPSTTQAMERIFKGLVDATASGLEVGRAEAAPLARVVAIALWDHQNMDVLARDAETATRITHRDPRVVACAAAAAAGIASNVVTKDFLLGPFLDAMADAAGRYDAAIREAVLDFPRVLCQSERRALRQIASLLPDNRYPPGDDGLGEYCVPQFFSAVYYFLRSPHSYEKTVESCLRLGGHIDVVTFIAGALSGALVDDRKLPRGLVDGLLNGGEISVYAQQLFDSWTTP